MKYLLTGLLGLLLASPRVVWGQKAGAGGQSVPAAPPRAAGGPPL